MEKKYERELRIYYERVRHKVPPRCNSGTKALAMKLEILALENMARSLEYLTLETQILAIGDEPEMPLEDVQAFKKNMKNIGSNKI